MEVNTMYYFAYGSNMNHNQMKQRCPSAEFISRAKLVGYRFVYDGYSPKRNGSVANVIKSDKKDVVWGGLYKIDPVCRQSLDCQENYPNSYQRKNVKVIDDDNNEYEAFIYLRKPKKEGKPSHEYRKIVLEGAKDCGLPQDYIDNFINR